MRTRMGTARVTDDTWSFVLVTGDGVLAGAIDTILRTIARHDLEPAACLLVPFRLQQLFGNGDHEDPTFFVENPGGEDVVFSLHMHDDLYRLAPACVLMVARPGGGAAEVALECKGATRPELAAPGTLRHLGENVIFNLVHVPDDTAAAFDELANMLGPAVATHLVELAVQPLAEPAGVLDAEGLARCMPAFAGPAAISFPAIANRIRARIAQRLLVVDPRAAAEPLAAVPGLLSSERRSLAGLATARERMLAAREASPALHEALRAAARGAREAALAAALDALAELFELDGRRGPEPLFDLPRHAVYLSPLERVIIQSHDYAFRPSTDLAGMYGRVPGAVPPARS